MSSSILLGQAKKIYGREFDYKTLSAIDTFNPNDLPNYYVCCSYQSGILTDIDIYRKDDWMRKYLHTHATVTFKKGCTFFIYDNGKTKVGGYGRLFSKKIKFTDTAMLKNDTLIFKTTRLETSSILIKYITSIYSDSITVDDKIFALGRRALLQSSSLSSFDNYLQWNLLNDYSRYYQLMITPKGNDIIKSKKILDPYADYSFSGKYTKEYFMAEKIIPSLFWIRHIGIMD